MEKNTKLKENTQLQSVI